ncbi:hypothetical protein DSL72_009196 [Monilinia vaccinii-corymbosi]|uniref:Non-structural maintenance of chromosomes element 4 n=1 Tax=Monilinia vaccinii-corymbosi TaxID=61207 RepID=A0A8A3PQD4_9HELO|nr:hypothetical protein DSL72_009196 [Monilinia vaccinii-corymbosi]
MSRMKILESPAPRLDEDLYEATPGPDYPRRTANSQALSPSPAASTSSDKENRSSRAAIDKGKGRAPSGSMGPPKVPSPVSKRKRTATAGEGDDSGQRSQRRRIAEVGEGDDVEDGQEYDPDQSAEERRQLRSELRGLSRTFQDNRAEYLNAESTGIRDTLLKANKLSGRVKQTSDATIDSRLLVSTADLAKKKTLRMTSGDTAQGVDLDDFVSKIKLYMRRERSEAFQGHAPRNTQRSRRDGAVDDEDSDNDNDGEMLNWDYLGRNACLPNNARPSVPGFLLGPLSLQKRARRAIVRRAPLRTNNLQETRPEVLKANDIEKSENANLTYLCTKIQDKLRAVQEKLSADAEDVITEEMTEEERRKALRDQFDMSENSSIAYFKFVINPYSFGQTIENMFYVSFLVRDGKVEVDIDPDGLPYIGIKEADGGGSSSHTARHQAVLSLDMHDWQEMIDLFDIKEPMIDHREEQDTSNIGAKGWYA